jgi:hypothetical protein
MPTERYFVCTKGCPEQWAGRLFDALSAQVENDLAPCSCGAQRYLKVGFPFAFGEKEEDHVYWYRVLAAFLPKEACKWKAGDGSKVAYYPFLIVCESLDCPDPHRSIWLPYWHVVSYPDDTSATKFDQWAPHMETRFFASLIDQAREKGFLT